MSIRTLSELLDDIKTLVPGETVTIRQLLEAFHERGFGFALFITALPAALPLPALGLNLILAAPLIVLTAQQAVGRHTIWLPEKLKNVTITRKKMDDAIDGALPWVRRIEMLVQPRMAWITQGLWSRAIGVVGLFMALVAAVPLPLTNTVPSCAIACMGIGVLMRDGLAVLAGAALGLAWVALLSYAVLFVGMEGLEMVKDAIKSFF